MMEQDRANLFFGRVVMGVVLVVLWLRYTNFNSVILQTAEANDHQHRFPDFTL